MTYLQLVNSVLTRLREDTVTGVSQNAYSRLIGEFVNDAKREVEDAHNWNALRTTLTATTSDGVFSHALVDSTDRFRLLNAINDTDDFFMEQRSPSWFDDQLLTKDVVKGSPRYFTFNGVDSNGDTAVDIYPVPDKAYTLRFNMVRPQATLDDDATTLLVPNQPVILGAYARALIERGEDGGLAANEAAVIYQSSLSDHIAIEANRYPSELDWNVT